MFKRQKPYPIALIDGSLWKLTAVIKQITAENKLMYIDFVAFFVITPEKILTFNLSLRRTVLYTVELQGCLL